MYNRHPRKAVTCAMERNDGEEQEEEEGEGSLPSKER